MDRDANGNPHVAIDPNGQPARIAFGESFNEVIWSLADGASGGDLQALMNQFRNGQKYDIKTNKEIAG